VPALALPTIYYFSDVLCVWAYVSQVRLDELVRTYDGQINIELRNCSVFPDAREKVATTWAKRGGYDGFSAHLQDVGGRFPHIEVHRDIWSVVRPRTSTGAHQFLKAVQLVEDAAGGVPESLLASSYYQASQRIRRAFFEEARDISNWRVQGEIAEALGLDFDAVTERIRSGEAVARLDADHKLADQLGVTGSPTLVMNDGRQKLFGNVGYHLIEANVQELLRQPDRDQASWC